MRRTCRVLFYSVLCLAAAMIPVRAFAAEPVAGDACSTSNQIVVTGGPETTGVRHTLRCNGTKWVQEQTIDASGNSGFGTASPAARIDVNGGARVGYNSGGCSGTNNGEIRYNSASPAWTYCNGSAWVPFEGCEIPGEHWVKQTGSGARGWGGIAMSADGTKLVAVDSAPGYVYTSADSGVTWTVHTGPGTQDWDTPSMSADGSVIAAPSYGNKIYISTDGGTNWTGRAGNANWAVVAVSPDGTKMLATQYGGTVYTSTNSGTNWTPHTVSGASQLWGAAISADGTKMAVSNYPGYIYTSSDSGSTWTQRATSTNWDIILMSTDGTKLAAVQYGGQVYTSTDSGATWTLQNGTPYASYQGFAGSSDLTKLILVADGGAQGWGGASQVYTSIDSGVTWKGHFTKTFDSWAVTSSADGTKLAVADYQTGYIYTSYCPY